LLSWLRLLVSGLSLRGPIFNPVPHYVGFVVNEVTLGRNFP